jgi:hypothetical protein
LTALFLYLPPFLRLVLETLDPLPGDRKCFRMINGVLVERTVEDVIPALKTNSDGLKKVLEELMKQYKKQQEEMDRWKASAPLPCVTPRVKLKRPALLKQELSLTDWAEEEQRASRAAMRRQLRHRLLRTCCSPARQMVRSRRIRTARAGARCHFVTISTDSDGRWL